MVNITKFGAFVNVLPGRDGLLHISKLSSLAGGKRINNVEDVLVLGQAVEVRVDDIDPQGKVSLSLASAPEGAPEPSGRRGAGNGDAAPAACLGAVDVVGRLGALLRGHLRGRAGGGPRRPRPRGRARRDSGRSDRGDRGDRGNDRRPSRGRSRRR